MVVAVVTVLVGVLVGEPEAVAVGVVVAVGPSHRVYPVAHVLIVPCKNPVQTQELVVERHGPLPVVQLSQSSGETVAAAVAVLVGVLDVVTVLVGVLVGEPEAVAVGVVVAVGPSHRKYPVAHVFIGASKNCMQCQ